jgi:ubiquinone/menaquinone biosynthesis C-methylase UbiE
MTTGVRNNDRLRQFVLARLAQPHGWAGRVEGIFLATVNREMNYRAVDALHLPSSAHVLEVGYGPGVGIAALAARVPEGQVAGIDPSVEMLHQASARNRPAVQQGRVDLRHGVAAALPWGEGTFDAALSLNSVLVWKPLAPSLREVYRVLRPGGRFLVGFHEIAARAQAEAGNRSLEAVERQLDLLLADAGFRPVATERVRLRIGRAMWVVVERPK